MIERELKVINTLGLHARAAAKLVQLTGKFRSKVELLSQGRRVDAKSILGILLLASAKGTTLLLAVEGEDEQDAANAVEELFKNRFGESR